MKGIFKILSIIILLAALIGAGVLVRNNQETRRGATSAETSSMILPSKITTTVGVNFDTHVWVNTGSATDKLSGAELTVLYDATKAKYVSSVAQNGYTVLNDTIDNGSGTLTFKMITLGSELSGAIDLLKITFQPVSNVGGSLLTQGKLMISGQSTTWDIASNSPANYAGASGVVTVVPSVIPTTRVSQATITPTRTPSAIPTRVVPTTTTNPGQCGQRCTTNSNCGSGMLCSPIWWPCSGTVPAELLTKIQQNLALDVASVNQMVSLCPAVNGLLPTGTASVKMPTFYGVCRNQSCLSSASCSCVSQITPTRAPPATPEVTRTTTSIPNSDLATLGLNFDKTKVAVGDIVTLDLSVSAGNSKISAVNTKIKFFTDNAQFLDVTTDNGGMEIKKIVDVNARTATFYYTWSASAANLASSRSVAKLRFKATGPGLLSASFDDSYASEVSGVNSAGTSMAFKLTKAVQSPVTITNAVAACTMCNSGLSKSQGNANCDGLVNSVDFEMWRSDMFDKGGLAGMINNGWNSDFNCDGKVNGIDFELWRKSVFQ